MNLKEDNTVRCFLKTVEHRIFLRERSVNISRDMRVPEQFWKYSFNFHYLVISDLTFSFPYFYLLVQDPVPFYQPISFSTTQSHAAAGSSHIGTYQPASPCDSRAQQALICYTCWKNSRRNNFKPQRGLILRCLHHSSTSIISECLCSGKYRTGYLCDTEKALLFFFSI